MAGYMQLIKAISFDLDGTLVKTDYVDAVWLEEIPKIYADKNKISFKEAKDYIIEEYEKVGPDALEWYDINYWIKKFDLNCSYKDILTKCIDKLKLYPEVDEVLKKLSKKAMLIITSNAANEFIEIEIEHLGLKKYISNIFSVVSDFRKTKKDKEIYEKICNEIGLDKEEIIHVGDSYEFDYLAPRRAGIKAFYLDRKGEMNGSFVVKNLKEFEEKVGKFLKS